ncbi:MAG: FAD-dependent oxidoreductase [Candidatus Binatia bacterium]|nr:FAD-dependent oxidoreductase [Candidatus Binatia bacterium]
MVSSRKRRVLIVGGVAGGASCAARLRRLDEECEIVLFDRGPHVSFANCGLPYYVGNVITEERRLLVATRELFYQRFNIDVQTLTEARAIDRAERLLRVCDLRTGKERLESYDALVLAPGAAAIRPSCPGVELPGIFSVRSIPDSRAIRSWIEDKKPERAVVVGGGLIGLEMVENLAQRGLKVCVLEKLNQLVPPLDPEMAAWVTQHLEDQGVEVHLGDGLHHLEQSGENLVAVTDSGCRYPAGLVILALGVRPEVQLAREAGLAIGPRGGIIVDQQMRTSDPHIWAVGDAVEVHDVVTGQETILPLAGPANRQGRIAADAIAGRPSRFRGVQGTAIVGIFGLTVACTGATEKGLRRAGVENFRVVYLHPGHHAGYYPGAKPIHLKLLFSVADGRVLGAQAVGYEGVDKRIDVIATAIQFGGTVDDLAEAELCYAPQYGAAKDPVNVAGMIAQNVLRGDVELADWQNLGRGDILLVDVREQDEFAAGHIPGAVSVPLSQLRQRYIALPRDRKLYVYCGVGQRAYFATRFLSQLGYEAANLSGGYATYLAMRSAGLLPRD